MCVEEQESSSQDGPRREMHSPSGDVTTDWSWSLKAACSLPQLRDRQADEKGGQDLDYDSPSCPTHININTYFPLIFFPTDYHLHLIIAEQL